MFGWDEVLCMLVRIYCSRWYFVRENTVPAGNKESQSAEVSQPNAAIEGLKNHDVRGSEKETTGRELIEEVLRTTQYQGLLLRL